MQIRDFIYVIFVLTVLSVPSACVHDTLLGESPMIDSMMTDTMILDTMVTDTMMDDTTHQDTMQGCDTTVIYFEQDVLPILRGSCAFAGCHDAASARDGVILVSYEQVIRTTGTVPFDLSESDLYEAITDDDLDKRMPPEPRDALSQEDIATIATWILQGAEDLVCEEASDCDIDDVSYGEDILPVLRVECQGCHSGSSPSAGIAMDDYDDIKSLADNGLLFAVINWDSGVSPMPKGREQLSQCFIDQLKKWIDEGAQNN